MKFPSATRQFVADHSDTYQVKRLCELVELERSSYYAWKSAEPARAARAEADAQLAERIRVIHTEDNTYGAPRITAELNDGVTADEKVNHKRVARVMRENNIAGYRRRRRVTTTVPEPAGHKVPDLLERDFTAPAPKPYLRRRHHVLADRGRGQPVSGDGDRLLFTQTRRLGDRRPYAHRPRRRRPPYRRPGS